VLIQLGELLNAAKGGGAPSGDSERLKIEREKNEQRKWFERAANEKKRVDECVGESSY